MRGAVGKRRVASQQRFAAFLPPLPIRPFFLHENQLSVLGLLTGEMHMQFVSGCLQFVGDCLPSAGIVLLLGVAAITACILTEGLFNLAGWLTQTLLQWPKPDHRLGAGIKRNVSRA